MSHSGCTGTPYGPFRWSWETQRGMLPRHATLYKAGHPHQGTATYYFPNRGKAPTTPSFRLPEAYPFSASSLALQAASIFFPGKNLIVQKIPRIWPLPLPLLSSFACITLVIPRGLPLSVLASVQSFLSTNVDFFILSLQNLQCLRFYQESSSLYIKFLHDLTPVTSLTRSPSTTLYSLFIASQPLWPHFFR